MLDRETTAVYSQSQKNQKNALLWAGVEFLMVVRSVNTGLPRD